MRVTILLTAVCLVSVISAWLGTRRIFRQRKMAIIVPLALLALFGFALILVENNNLATELARRHWPHTSGQIVASIITGTRAPRPLITYRYVVDGETYSAQTDLDTPMFGRSADLAETAMKVISAYPEGETVTVYYNPSRPAESLLKPNLTWDVLTKLALGVLLLWMGLSGFLGALLSQQALAGFHAAETEKKQVSTQ